MNRLQFHLVFAFLLFMVLPVDLVAQGGSAPVIVSATVQYEPDIPWQLTIAGRNFKPAGTNPTIYFGNTLLTSLSSVSDTLVEASLPSKDPGTYLLGVTNSKKVTGTAYVTIGAVGPTGGRDQPQNFNVNCNEGGSVTDALEQAGDGVARLTIGIEGNCNQEGVSVTRNNVTLYALTPGAGLRDIVLDGAHGIQLEALTLLQTFRATNGAAFVANNVKVTDAFVRSVMVEDSASGTLNTPTLTNCPDACIDVIGGGSLNVNGGTLEGNPETSIGVRIENGGSIHLSGTTIRSSMLALSVIFGGSADVQGATIKECRDGISTSGAVRVDNTTIENNLGGGLNVQPGGSAVISGSHIIDNDGGGAGTEGGALRIYDSEILRNGGPGFGANLGGRLYLWGCTVRYNGQGTTSRGATLNFRDTVISDNGGRGIEARNASTLLLVHTTVENNAGDGIWLGDVSFLEVSPPEPGGPPSVIKGNKGWGLRCSPAPSVAQYKVYSSGLEVAENTDGQISCVEATN